MSAALAASETSGVSITIVDDNPRLGGQIWRAELGHTKSADAQRLIKALETKRISIVNDAQVFAASDENRLAAETSDGRTEFEYEKLVIATGARELFLPFPGWTLPNVFGAGGLQALVKGGLPVNGKKIVIAGTGPLLMAVAAYLKDKGADIVAIAEQAPSAKINKFAIGLWRSPAKAVQALKLRAKLLGVRYLTGCWITSCDGTDKLRSVTLTRQGRTFEIECDYVACGFHLIPNTELALLLGCRLDNGCVVVDEFQRTTCENIYCAGEPTGIGGVETALIEGTIAGRAAAGDEEKARRLFKKRAELSNFARSMNTTFELRDELRSLADEETIICRCEDVSCGRLKEYDSRRVAKLQTRCGMGACQGRVCGPATKFLFGWKPDNVRPPIFPVRMENL